MKKSSKRRSAIWWLYALLLAMALIGPGIASAADTKTTTQKAAASTVTVKFVGENGWSTTRTYTVGNKYSALPSPPNKNNFTFVGWYTSGSGGTRIYTSTTVSSSYKTLYARYKGKSSEVTFNSNGGSSVKKKTVYYSSQYGSLTSPTKTGYSFDGWFTKSSGGSKVTAKTTVTTTSNHTLYAHWTAKKYTVYFNSQGGSSVSSKTVTYNSTYGSLTTPSKTGYTFGGWYTSASGGTKISPSTKVTITSNQTLYAHWTANTYTVGFNSNGGTAVDSIHVIYNSTYGTLPTTTRTGYVFQGWFTAIAGGTQITPSTKVTITSGQTLYAQWKAEDCTITFDANGGYGQSNLTSLSVEQGTEIGTRLNTSPGAPANMHFVGWYDAKTGGKQYTSTSRAPYQKTLTLYAHWEQNSYWITFNKNAQNGVTGSMSNMTCLVGSSYYLTTNAFGYQGYTFTGWNTKADGTGVSYSDGAYISNLSTSNGATVTLYAQWDIAYCNITFDVNGGSGQSNLTSLNVQQGTTIGSRLNTSPGAPTNMHFTGWYNAKTGGTQYTSNSKAPYAKTLKLYAHWDPNYYWITFNNNAPNGVSGTMENMKCLVGSSYNLNLNKLSRTGYTFEGWNTKANGTGTSYADGAYISDLSTTNGSTVTLYAKWGSQTYTVRFESDCDAVVISKKVTYNEKYGELAAPQKEGYDFKGWHLASPDGEEITPESIVTIAANHTLYARWEPSPLTVSFDVNGGTGTIKDKKVKLGKKYEGMTAPVKSGYTFIGWFTDKNGGERVNSNTEVTIPHDHILYAHWKTNSSFRITDLLDLSGVDTQETNPEGWMVHNAYCTPDVYNQTIGKFTGFMIDFMTDSSPRATYWSLCNFSMDTSKLTTYQNPHYHFGDGAYMGFQAGEQKSIRKTILSFWDLRSNNHDPLAIGNKPIYLIADSYIGDNTYETRGDKETGEGYYMRYQTDFKWESNKWYRVYLGCSYENNDPVDGNTYVELYVKNLTDGTDWQLFYRIDTGLKGSWIVGSMSQFLENFAGVETDGTIYSNDLRTFALRNIYVREKGSKDWKFISNVTLSTDSFEKKIGIAGLGCSETTLYGITCGYGCRDGSAGRGLKLVCPYLKSESGPTPPPGK